jgi:transcriptional regulator with XRE-family HTH domain
MRPHILSSLRTRRMASGVNPIFLARAIGVELNTYYRYENGTRRIHFDKACVLADKLGCSLDDLRGGNELPERRHVESNIDGTVVAIAAAVPEGWDVD